MTSECLLPMQGSETFGVRFFQCDGVKTFETCLFLVPSQHPAYERKYAKRFPVTYLMIVSGLFKSLMSS